ncbi:hypothetical protein LRP49_17440 [Enterovibrio sp. ZSDZ35]|uniref:Plasmid replication protein RepB n=1 Tax=Enterovibrio qingdaonensis TaxID=2899818 RepID=A0ABT5QQ06_9GAMM|nr:hypothetical protein [Enterovibrio sp. ZSDZ35]MDD1782959.1 hypothetical protein [Enterovibrio sp. ZSDZ35]
MSFFDFEFKKGFVMELQELKTLFENGVLKEALVCPAAFNDGYNLMLSSSKSKMHILTAQRSNGEPRHFKTIDSAVANAEKIGFKKISIHLSETN